MKKNRIVFLLILSILTFSYSCQNNQKDTIKIGAVIPLTGETAKYGLNVKRGIELAKEEINDSILNNIIIVYEDSKANARDGVNAVNKVISHDKVPIYITFASDVVLATAPIANKNKVILFNCLAQSPDIRDAGDFVFSNINDANVETYQMAEFVYDSLNVKKIAIVYCSKNYGVGAKNALERKFKELGGEISALVEFHEGNRDFRKQIESLKKSDVSTVFVAGISGDITYLQKQAYEQNYLPQWLSFTSYEGDEIFKVAGIAAENTIFTSTAFDLSNNELAANFVRKYKEKYNEIPDIYVATGYDAYRVIYNALKSGAKTGNEIKDYFHRMPIYDGITGITQFDDKGCVNKPVKFKIVKNGTIIHLQ